ncbi:MAG: hypothetical protein KAI47_15215 [Deltaproteobacteria bacterium]|nr:hypothetical protein [Deltaproteobacteria bacterium]
MTISTGRLSSRLSAYPLLLEACAGRRVFHLGAKSAGTDLLASGGAQIIFGRRVFADVRSGRGVACIEEALPFPAHSMDVVVAPGGPDEGALIEGKALDEVARILAPEGFIVLMARDPERGEPGEGSELDYWSLRGRLEARFRHVAILALAPAAGFYVSYLESTHVAERLTLHDELLVDDPGATHFLALAGARELPRLDPYSLVSVPLDEAKPAVVGRVSSEVARNLAMARRDRDGARRELEDTQRQVAQSGQRIERAERAVTEVALERDRFEAEARRAMGLVTRGEEERSELRSQVHEFTREVERALRQEEVLKRQLEGERLKGADLTDAVASQRERQAALIVDRDRLSERLLAEEERRHEEARERARAEQRVSGLAEEVEALSALRQENVELEAEVLARRNDLTRMEVAAEVLGEELRGLHGERRDLFGSLREQREARAEVERALEHERQRGDDRRGELRRTLKNLEEELAERVREKDQLLHQSQDLEVELHRIERSGEDLAVAQALVEQLEDRLARAQERIGEAESAEERFREELALARRHRQDLEAAIAELRGAERKQRDLEDERQGEVEALRRALSEAEEASFQLESAVAAERRDLFRALRTRDELGVRLESIEGERDRERDELAALRQKMEDASTQQRDFLRDLSGERAREAAAYELEIDVRAGEMAVALGEIERVEGEIWTARDEALCHAARVEAALASADDARQHRDDADDRVAAIEAAMVELRRVQGILEEERSGLEVRADELLWDRERARGEAWRLRNTAREVMALRGALERVGRGRALLEARAEELLWDRERARGEAWKLRNVTGEAEHEDEAIPAEDESGDPR